MKRLVLVLMVVLSLFSVSVLADSTNYQVDNVYLDGMNLDDALVNVERGETLDLYVYLTGISTDEDATSTDVNVKAWIGGYEYDTVQVASEMFDIENGVSYREKLQLELPSDLEAEKDYTLYVEIYDDVNSLEYTATIHVDRARHLLDIIDTLVDNSVDAGDYTTVTVRLEDMGEQKEEDIKVTVSVAELGIEKSIFLDELASDEIDNEDEESSGEVDLTFEVPASAETGDYTLNVLVTYDNGYETLEDSSVLHVEGAVTEEAQEDSTVTVVVGDSAVDETDGSNFSTALRLGFGILAVLIVILALILIVRR